MFGWFKDKRIETDRREYQEVVLHDGVFYKQVLATRMLYPQEAEDLARDGLLMISSTYIHAKDRYDILFAKIIAFTGR